MKFNTPRCPRVFRGFPLLEKGGISLGRGGLGSWCLPYAPLGASLADGDALALVGGVGHATRFGEVTAARKALDPILFGASLGWLVAVRQLVIGKGRLRRTIREVVGALQVIAGVGLWAVE